MLTGAQGAEEVEEKSAQVVNIRNELYWICIWYDDMTEIK